MTVRSMAARGAALGALTLLTAGCTRLLGIDGEYGLSSDSAGGAAATFDGAGGASGADVIAGGESGLGGDDSGMGVTSAGAATGGTGAGRDAAAELTAHGGEAGAATVGAGTGGVNSLPPPVGPCAPGAYEGPQSGQHAPTITVLGVELKVSGNVKFRLGSADSGVSAIVDGSIDGTLQILGTPPFSATLTGKVECETGRFDGVVDGKFWFTSNVNAPPVSSFHGTYDGAFSSGQFSGTWSEEEPNAPTMPPGTDTGRGSGTWSATRTGP